jgi:hypothetical protein
MPETFIVTIASVLGDFEIDLEIPSGLSFAEFKEKLLRILQILNEHEFQNWQDYCLLYKNRVLAETETLACVGAFDGSRLVVARRIPSQKDSTVGQGRAWQIWQSFKDMSQRTLP